MHEHAQKLVRVFSAVSFILPFNRVRNLRWGSRWQSMVIATLVLHEGILAQILSNFDAVERMVLEDIRGFEEIMTAVASDASLLPRLSSLHFLPRVLPAIYMPPVPHNQESPAENLHILVDILRRVAAARNILTLEFGDEYITEENLSAFKGIASQLLLSA